MLGLEMLALARAHPKSHPWLENVRGMISLGGVLFGSDLADDAMNAAHTNPPSPTAAKLVAARTYADALQVIPKGAGFLKKAAVVGKNLLALMKFGATMAKLSLPPPGPFNIKDIIKKLKDTLVSASHLDFHAPLDLLHQFLVGAFHLNHSFADYNHNILSVKAFTSALLEAIPQMTRAARLEWWKTSKLPTRGIQYYAIAGTMVDADPSNPVSTTLAGSTVNFNQRLLDFSLVLSSYRDYRTASGVKVNDSQVAAHKVRFWPELHAQLHPGEAPLAGTFLGVVGADHWGLALRVVNETKAGDLNPFPRLTLLQALAAAVAMDLKAGVAKP
jgi:hypothetical protein